MALVKVLTYNTIYPILSRYFDKAVGIPEIKTNSKEKLGSWENDKRCLL